MENEKILNQILEKVEENNKILHKIRRASFWGNVFRIFYWAIIILSAIGAYWLIQPYYNTITSAYNEIQNGLLK